MEQFDITFWMTKGPKGSHDCEAQLLTLDRAFFNPCDARNYRERQKICKELQFGNKVRLRLTAYQVARFFIQRRLDGTQSRLKWDNAVEITPKPFLPVLDLTPFSGGPDAGT